MTAQVSRVPGLVACVMRVCLVALSRSLQPTREPVALSSTVVVIPEYEKGSSMVERRSEAVWPSGKVLYAGKQKDLGSIRFGSRFSPKIVVYAHCLVTLPTQLMKR